MVCVFVWGFWLYLVFKLSWILLFIYYTHWNGVIFISLDILFNNMGKIGYRTHEQYIGTKRLKKISVYNTS